ncbi:MAG: hypothetical protein COB30_001690 [Ectothiorhodospiraceae bacterium]|nr:hypothetical protein [Ectothiorhodospiraceae bacterium]
MSDSGIEILLSSDSDYEELTAEIFYNGKFIALLNQDDGVENLKIEFPAVGLDENMVLRKIDLTILEQGLELAKKKIRG